MGLVCNDLLLVLHPILLTFCRVAPRIVALCLAAMLYPCNSHTLSFDLYSLGSFLLVMCYLLLHQCSWRRNATWVAGTICLRCRCFCILAFVGTVACFFCFARRHLFYVTLVCSYVCKMALLMKKAKRTHASQQIFLFCLDGRVGDWISRTTFKSSSCSTRIRS